MGRGETATSLGKDGRRSPRNRCATASPTRKECSPIQLPTLVPAIRAIGSCRFQARAAGLRATRQEDVISMRALVVYESMYGNTQVIAGNIADGLRGDYEVTLVPVAEARAGPPVGHDARRGEQDVPARASLKIAKAR